MYLCMYVYSQKNSGNAKVVERGGGGVAGGAAPTNSKAGEPYKLFV